MNCLSSSVFDLLIVDTASPFGTSGAELCCTKKFSSALQTEYQNSQIVNSRQTNALCHSDHLNYEFIMPCGALITFAELKMYTEVPWYLQSQLKMS